MVRIASLLRVPLLLILAGGCQNPDGRSTVTLWHQMVPAERAVLEEEIRRFEALNPGIDIEALYKETEELRSGFQAAVLAGVGPELVYGPSDPMGPFQTMGIIQDLSPWLDEEQQEPLLPQALTWLPSRTDPQRRELLHVGDRVGNHLALVYNRHLLPHPPATTEEWIRLAREQTVDTNGDGVVDRYGLVWNYIEPYFAIPFLTGFGAWIFQGETPQPALDRPEVVRALEFIIALRDQHQVIPRGCDYEMADALFKSGRAAMIINGDWSWADYLENPNLDRTLVQAAIAPLPVVSETGLAMQPMMDAKGYCLNALAEGTRREHAIRFLKHMLSKETQRRFLHRLKTLPSHKELYNDPLFERDVTLQTSLKQLQQSRRMPVVSEMRAVWDGMRPHYQALLAANETPQQAAAGMQATTEHLIRKLRDPHSEQGWAASILSGLLVGLAAIACYVYREALWHLPRDLVRLPLAYAFIIPALLVLVCTIVYPFFYNIVLSFSNMSLARFQDWQVTGLQNYVEVFSSPTFYLVLLKTIVWTAVNVFFHVALGVFLAVMLHGPIRGKTIYRALLIIPWAVPSYITALTWRGMFDLHFGLINNLLVNWLGLQRVDWLGDETNAFLACIVTNIWLGVPFMMVITLGGLQGISQELYEAARLDRATRWDQFWHITLPMLRPVLLPAVTLGAIWTFNNLNVIWLVSNGGQPSDKTHILVSYVYRAVFNLYQYGYGAALSMIIFGILLAFTLVFLSRTRAVDGV